MDRLIYTAGSGLSASMMRQRVIASNMANAQTVGFRAEVMVQAPVTLTDPEMEVRAFGEASLRGASMKPGAMMPTGRALDVACTGETMLTVQAPDGSEAYTRRGDLSVSVTGVLQNGEGLPVIGANGPITVPGSQVAIAADGAVLVTDPAAPDQPPTRADTLKLANPRGSQVTKAIDGLFRVPGGGVLPADADARLAPATLEAPSNVDPASVLVEMVEAQRLFDIRAKTISTARDLDEASASLMRIDS